MPGQRMTALRHHHPQAFSGSAVTAGGADFQPRQVADLAVAG